MAAAKNVEEPIEILEGTSDGRDDEKSPVVNANMTSAHVRKMIAEKMGVLLVEALASAAEEWKWRIAHNEVTTVIPEKPVDEEVSLDALD